MIRLLLLSAAMLLTAAGCSSLWGGSGAEQAGVPIKSAELFLARASLTTTEFEQYRLENEKVFAECGELKRGRVVPGRQKLVTVPAETRTKLEAQAAHLVPIVEERGADLPPAGKNAHLADPGQFLLTFTTEDGRTVELKTSLDAITSSEMMLPRRMSRFARELRAVGGGICGNKSFYGLRPLEPSRGSEEG